MVPFVNISGYGFSGKSTISRILANRHRTLWRPRITSRPPRPGEVPGNEYLFATAEEFKCRNSKGEVLHETVHPVFEGGRAYSTGILRPEFWPQPCEKTELILSAFGRAAWQIKRDCAPEMITFLVKVSDKEELAKRMILREERVETGVHARWDNNTWYEEIGLDADFDHVFYNDSSPEECVEQIERIAGLLIPR
ncbi:MAG: hypothetical protein ABIS26_01210 [Candidatus Paceibacterota bacterium]